VRPVAHSRILRRVSCASSQADGDALGWWLQYHHTKPHLTPNLPLKERIMNIRKNFEALFLAAAALGLAASFAIANERPVEIAASTAPAIDMATIQTVVVSAPRLAAR
jgi:hypothetical protein